MSPGTQPIATPTRCSRHLGVLARECFICRRCGHRTVTGLINGDRSSVRAKGIHQRAPAARVDP